MVYYAREQEVRWSRICTLGVGARRPEEVKSRNSEKSSRQDTLRLHRMLNGQEISATLQVTKQRQRCNACAQQCPLSCWPALNFANKPAMQFERSSQSLKIDQTNIVPFASSQKRPRQEGTSDGEASSGNTPTRQEKG
jgi:hypothetical protein